MLKNDEVGESQSINKGGVENELSLLKQENEFLKDKIKDLKEMIEILKNKK